MREIAIPIGIDYNFFKKKKEEEEEETTPYTVASRPLE
jgi:hypothetical protein